MSHLEATNIDWSHEEVRFINKIMEHWGDEFDSEEMFRLFLHKEISRHVEGNVIVTAAAYKLTQSILEKLRQKQFDDELAKMLSDDIYLTKVVKSGHYDAPKSTKRLSYEKTLENLSPLHQAILDAVKAEPDLSRAEIAAVTGISLQSVCARVKELLYSKRLVVSGRKDDKASNRTVETLAVAGANQVRVANVSNS